MDVGFPPIADIGSLGQNPGMIRSAGLCALLAWCLLPSAGGQARAEQPQPAVSDQPSQEASIADWCAGERPPEFEGWGSTPGARAWAIQPSFHTEGVQRLARGTFQPIRQRDARRLTDGELPRSGHYYLARLGVAAPVDATAAELAELVRASRLMVHLIPFDRSPAAVAIFQNSEATFEAVPPSRFDQIANRNVAIVIRSPTALRRTYATCLFYR